jgi:hypothetical protein
MSRHAHTPRPLTTIHDLTLDARNANRGTPRGQALLADSLTTFGAGRSIVADRHGCVVAGNKTVAQAQAIDLPIHVVETTGDALVVVQRTDLDLTAGGPARQLALADNRIGQLDLEWDATLLAQFQAEGVPFRDLWTPAELEPLFGHGLHPGLIPEDAVVPITPTSIVPGDLFELGPHRLVCGDATVAAEVGVVVQDARPVVLITDPPYGVAYDPAWRIRAGCPGRHAVGAVRNDDRVDWGAALAHFAGPVAYLWHAGLHSGTVAQMVQASGFEIRAQIIWVKPHFVLGRGDFHWQHEPCVYAVRAGHASNWCGGRGQSTVWSVAHLNPFAGGHDAANPDTGHSTQKPVALYERALICNSAPGDAMLDPFVGSGTALIAAQKTGRRCLAMELEPTYVQLAVDRWEAYTGQVAQRHETSARR